MNARKRRLLIGFRFPAIFNLNPVIEGGRLNVNGLSVFLVAIGVKFDALSWGDRPVAVVDDMAVSNLSSMGCPVRNASIELLPPRTGTGIFETTVWDNVLPVVVGGRQLNVVNVEAVVVAGRCSLELESVGSGLNLNVEGCSLDRVVRGVESTDDFTVPKDVSLWGMGWTNTILPSSIVEFQPKLNRFFRGRQD
jgi:hypothetical protein